jgi:hypothetical protein
MTGRQYSSPTAAIVLCLLASLTCGAILAAEPKRVLLLHPSSGANLLSAMKIRSELERQSPERLEVYDASLVTGRPIDEIVAVRYGDYLRSLFPDQRLDLAVVVGGAALRLYQRYRLQLFPSTPLLAIAEERRFPASNFRENETTITTKIDPAGVIVNILQMLPETTNVAVVIGNSPIGRYWVEQMRVAFRPFESQLSFTWLNDLVLEDMLNRAATLPARSAIYFSFILADAANVARDEDAVFSVLTVSLTLLFSVTATATSARGLLAVRSSRWTKRVKRRLVRPFAFCAASLQLTSKSHLSDFQRPNSIGGKCGAGASVRLGCRLEARLIFAIRRHGSDIAGKS